VRGSKRRLAHFQTHALQQGWETPRQRFIIVAPNPPASSRFPRKLPATTCWTRPTNGSVGGDATICGHDWPKALTRSAGLAAMSLHSQYVFDGEGEWSANLNRAFKPPTPAMEARVSYLAPRLDKFHSEHLRGLAGNPSGLGPLDSGRRNRASSVSVATARASNRNVLEESNRQSSHLEARR
jgi:hypothetical protein